VTETVDFVDAGISARFARLAGIVACLAPVVVAAQGGVKLVPQPGADPALGALLRQAAEQCIPLVGSYLKSKLSGDLEIFLFGSKEAFAAGLKGAGSSPALAARLAGSPNVHAVTRRRQVRVNQATTLPLSSRNRSEMVCHEVTHVFQYELGGGSRGASYQWVREGYAIYMGVVGLEHFALDTRTSVRRRALRKMRDEALLGRAYPALASLVSLKDYRDSIDRHGGRAHFAFMFLAADSLVRRTSHDAVAAYFRSARPGDRDLEPGFRRAFSFGVDEFQSQLEGEIVRQIKSRYRPGARGS